MRANYRHVMRVPEVGPLRNTVARDCLASAVALAGTDWQVFSALSGKLTAAVKRPAALATVLPGKSLQHLIGYHFWCCSNVSIFSSA